MSTVNRFEDLLAFQKARELVKEVYSALRYCKDSGFKDQIQRASVSILSNIAEGFESGTKEGFFKLSLHCKSIRWGSTCAALCCFGRGIFEC